MVSGMMWTMKRFYKVMGDCVYYEYIVSDDDTITRKNLINSQTRPTFKKHIGGYLPKDIRVPQRFSDPTHPDKCVVGDIL